MYTISSKFNKQTLKLYYGLVGRQEIWGFKSIREARVFLSKLTKLVNSDNINL